MFERSHILHTTTGRSRPISKLNRNIRRFVKLFRHYRARHLRNSALCLFSNNAPADLLPTILRLFRIAETPKLHVERGIFQNVKSSLEIILKPERFQFENDFEPISFDASSAKKRRKQNLCPA